MAETFDLTGRQLAEQCQDLDRRLHKAMCEWADHYHGRVNLAFTLPVLMRHVVHMLTLKCDKGHTSRDRAMRIGATMLAKAFEADLEPLIRMAANLAGSWLAKE